LQKKKNMNDNYKKEKLNNFIHQELAEVIRQEVEFGQGVLVSIGEVVCTSDLGVAKVWLSVWPEAAAVKALALLDKQKVLLRSQLAKKIEMRRVPKLRFIIDKDEIEDERQRNKVEEILKKIKREEK